MTRISWLCACAGTGLALSGCGGGTTTLPPPTVTDACAAYAANICNDLQRCAPGLEAFIGVTGPADCLSYYATGCLGAAAAPHSGFTAAHIQTCAKSVGAYTCAEFYSLKVDPNCRPSGGTIADGGSCTSDWQCASGRCSTAINACGICVARIARGDTCDPDHDGCADDLACSVVGGNSASYLCTPVVDVGGPCNDGAVCPANTHCGPMSHVCAAVPKLGEACDSMTTFFCDLNGPAAECDLNMCVAGPTPVQRGASCDAADGGTSRVSCLGDCLGPADGGSLICQDYVQGGQSCALGESCASGLACVNGVCGVCDGSNAPAAAHRTARASAPPTTALTKPGVSLRGRLRPPW